MSNTNTRKSKGDTVADRATAELLAAEAAAHEARLRLEAALVAVRGTRDIARPAAVGEHRAPLASVPAKPATLAERARAALSGPRAPMTVAELARALSVPAGRAQAELTKLRKAGEVVNAGEDEDPRWHVVQGDEAPTPAVYALVRKLVAWRPMSFAKLLEVTGARRGRVSGAIVDLQRSGTPIENRGTDARALWYIPR